MSKDFWRLSRRIFLQGGGLLIAGLIVHLSGITRLARAAVPIPKDRMAVETLTTSFKVNGKTYTLKHDSRTTLLDALRDKIGLTGSKKGCDQGQCGACTIWVDNRRVLACLTLTATVAGKAITTIEGLADADGTLHPMQAAFVKHDAFQCGYCTPGQIMSAVACVKEGYAKTDDDIREYMSGNLCRCAAYPKIVMAVKEARGQMEHA